MSGSTVIGREVALVVDLHVNSETVLPRGLVGTVVETFGGGRVKVAFDMSQGIPGAEYSLMRYQALYPTQYVRLAR